MPESQFARVKSISEVKLLDLASEGNDGVTNKTWFSGLGFNKTYWSFGTEILT